MGSPAAAVAAARLLGLDGEKSNNALSLAASMAGGSKRQFGTMAKPLHAGLAAQNGIMAARLAQAGVSAVGEILTGPWGMADLMAGSPKAAAGETDYSIADPLGIVRYGVWIKAYPCCASIHRAVDALLDLKSRFGFEPQDIDTIEARLSNIAANNLAYNLPNNPLEARFSVHYCVAAALVEGGLGPESFQNQAIQRPEVRELLPLIKKTADPDFENDQRSQLTVRLKDGSAQTQMVTAPRGHPKRPLEEAALKNKFMTCARAGGLLPARAGEIFDCCNDLASLKSVKRLTRDLQTLGGNKDE
jgi:2-methylcitrate dehydratase PrpD